MEFRTILILAVIIYIGFVYWLAVRFKFKDLWRGVDKNAITSPANQLTRFVKKVLDIVMLLLLFQLVMFVPILTIMAISQNQISTWGIDIYAFTGFKIDINALQGVESSGLRNPEITGKTLINIDTSNLFAWYFHAAISEIYTIVALYALLQLRALVISLKNGISFTIENSSRIKKIGIVVIIWNAVNPFLQYFGWGRVIKEITFTTEGILLYPAFEVNIISIFIVSKDFPCE